MDDMDDLEPTWESKSLVYWIEQLNGSGSDETRWKSVDAIHHICAPAESLGLLVSALSDKYWRARALAAHAICDIIEDEEDIHLMEHTVLPLSNALLDENFHVRLNAAYGLELLGPAAVAALPNLRNLLLNKNDELRQAAVNAISRIEGKRPGRAQRDN